VADITIRCDHVSHAASGVVMAEANYGSGPPKLEARISIHDDLFDDLRPAYYNGDTSVVAGMAFQLSFDLQTAPGCSDRPCDYAVDVAQNVHGSRSSDWKPHPEPYLHQ
jgi:hypothetical protein